MYDSPRTRLIKDVFDNDNNFSSFCRICINFETENNLPKIFERELRNYYNDLKKEIRKVFKEYTNQFDVDFENQEIISKIKNLCETAIVSFANEFCSNRIIQNRQHHILLARKVSDKFVSNLRKEVVSKANNVNEVKKLEEVK